MAKGQMRSNREKKKPKAEKNKNKSAPAALSFSSAMQAAGKGGGPGEELGHKRRPDSISALPINGSATAAQRMWRSARSTAPKEKGYDCVRYLASAMPRRFGRADRSAQIAPDAVYSISAWPPAAARCLIAHVGIRSCAA